VLSFDLTWGVVTTSHFASARLVQEALRSRAKAEHKDPGSKSFQWSQGRCIEGVRGRGSWELLCGDGFRIWSRGVHHWLHHGCRNFGSSSSRSSHRQAMLALPWTSNTWPALACAWRFAHPSRDMKAKLYTFFWNLWVRATTGTGHSLSRVLMLQIVPHWAI
jgi:hypothetical protein